jgi:hypothetical protein
VFSKRKFVVRKIVFIFPCEMDIKNKSIQIFLNQFLSSVSLNINILKYIFHSIIILQYLILLLIIIVIIIIIIITIIIAIIVNDTPSSPFNY